MITSLVGTPDLALTAAALTGIAAAFGLSAVTSVLQQHQQALLSAEIEHHQQRLLLERIARVELKRFESAEFQDLERRAMNAMGRVLSITAAVIGLTRDAFILMGILVALYLLHPLVPAVALLALAPGWLLSGASSRRALGFWRSMTPNERMRSYVSTIFTNREYAKEVRSYGLAPHLLARYELLSRRWMSEFAETRRVQTRYALLITLTGSLTTLLSLSVLGFLVVHGEIGIGEAGAGVAGLQQLSGQLRGVVNNITQLYESSLFLEDWYAFLALPPVTPAESAVAPASTFHRIEMKHVSFSYPGGTSETRRGCSHTRLALDKVSLTIEAGEVVALVGENGSGKTTIAKILCGLYQPDTGSVLWNGVDSRTRGTAWIAENTAAVFQDPARFMFSVYDNIAFGRIQDRDDRALVMSAACEAGADAFIRSWSAGYDTFLGTYFGGTDISIGQWQRVSLSRALFRNAPLIVLDEPTASLDPRAEHEFVLRTRALSAKRAVLLISHRLSNVVWADRIYVLEHGRVIQEGTHAQLMEQDGQYRRLFELQAAAYLAPSVEFGNAGRSRFLSS